MEVATSMRDSPLLISKGWRNFLSFCQPSEKSHASSYKKPIEAGFLVNYVEFEILDSFIVDLIPLGIMLDLLF